MAKHLQTGKWGEDLAAVWLAAQGFELLHRNWKHSYFELDVIAAKDGMLYVKISERCLTFATF